MRAKVRFMFNAVTRWIAAFFSARSLITSVHNSSTKAANEALNTAYTPDEIEAMTDRDDATMRAARIVKQRRGEAES